MMKGSYIFIIMALSYVQSLSCQNLLYSDKFNNGISNWSIEAEPDSVVCKTEGQILEIIAPKGFTLWYNKLLEGNLKITYEANVIDEHGKYDRISDLNCFWMANDPENPDNFFARSDWRKGTFGKYYSLTMYYVGYGGNSNTTTRFRKYNGDYEAFLNKTMRPDIIQEYTDSAHLIIPNKWNKIDIIVNESNIRYLFNNELLFDYNDPQPYKKGYFGIRTVTNHIKIRNFNVNKL